MRIGLRQALQLNGPSRSYSSRLATPAFIAGQCSIAPSRGTGSPGSARASIATITDWEGGVRNCLSGEMRFQGARRVYNSIATTSYDLSNAAWVKRNNHVASAPDNTGLSPITVTNALNNAQGIFGESIPSTPAGSYIIRFRAIAGSITSLTYVIKDRGTDTVRATATVTLQGGNGQVYSLFTTGVTTAGCRIEFYMTGAGSGNFWLGEIQVECVNGQSNQNPSEYVTVGVLSSPFIQTIFGVPFCCGVDGVAYLPWQNGNTVSSNIVTQGMGPALGRDTQQTAYLPASNANWFSTPNSSANTITGDLDLRFYGTFAWQSVSPGIDLIVKDHASGGPRCYALQHGAASAGKPRFFYTSDGTTTTGRVADATTTVPFLDNTAGWIRVTFQSSTGLVTFYTSYDGFNWTQLGLTITITAGVPSSLSTTLTIGASDGGIASILPNATVYRAQLYSGINGTLVVDFNPQDYVTGSTWTSSTTGEVWTKQGNSAILNNPLVGYLPEEQRTNLLLHSDDLSTTWVVTACTVATNGVICPDGTNSADKIQEDTSTAVHFVKQLVTKAGSALTYTFSSYLKQAERTWGFIQLDDQASNGCRVFINLLTGALGSIQTFGTPFTSVSATVFPAAFGFFRVVITATSSTITTIAAVIGTSTGDTVTNYTGTAGSGIYAWGHDLQQAGFVTSLIPTTTATVTRNSDVVSIPTAGHLIGTIGTTYCEAIIPNSNSPFIISDDNGGATNGVPLRIFSSAVSIYDVSNNRPGQAFTLSLSMQKLASVWSGTAGKTYANGAGTATAALDGDLTLGTTTWFGSRGNGANQVCGPIRNQMLWAGHAVPDRLLARITT